MSSPATAAPLDKAHPDFEAWFSRFIVDEHARHTHKVAHHVARALKHDDADPDAFPPAPTTVGTMDPFLHQRQDETQGFRYVSMQLLSALADPLRVAPAFRTLALANGTVGVKQTTPRQVVDAYRSYWNKHRPQGFTAFAQAYKGAAAIVASWNTTTLPADALTAVCTWWDALPPGVTEHVPADTMWRIATAAYVQAHPGAAATLLARTGATKANAFDPEATPEGFADAAEHVHGLSDDPAPVAALAGSVKRGAECAVCASFSAAHPPWKPAQGEHGTDACQVLQSLSSSAFVKSATGPDGVFSRLMLSADGKATFPPYRRKKDKDDKAEGDKPRKPRRDKSTTALASTIQCAMADGLLQDGDLIFDTGCEAHILSGHSSLPVTLTDAKATVRGFGGDITATWGKHPVLGDVLVAPDAPCSLFSCYQARETGWDITMADGFTARKGGNVLAFKPLAGRKLYVYAPSPPSPEAHLPRTAALATACEPTPEAREAGGAEGRVHADKLDAFLRTHHVALGHQPYPALAELLTSPHARVDLPRGATLASLSAAARHLQCADCLIGGNTRHVVRSDQEAADAKCFAVGTAIEVDFIFTGRGQDLPCLLAVELATGYLFLRPLTSRTTPRVVEAVVSIRDELAGMGHQLRLVRSDAEAVLLTLHDPLKQRGIEYDPYPPGVHAAHVERSVRTLKTRLRILLAAADARGISFPQRVRSHLFAYGIDAINATVSVHTAGSGMPRLTALTGKPVVLDKNVSFGDFVITRELEEKNRPWDKQRAHLGMVVRAPLDGSSSIQVLDLALNEWGQVTGRVHTRVQWGAVDDEPWMIERVKLLPAMSVPEFASDVASNPQVPPLAVTGVRREVPPPPFMTPSTTPASPFTTPSTTPASAALPPTSASSPAVPTTTAAVPPPRAPGPRLSAVLPPALPSPMDLAPVAGPHVPSVPVGPLSKAVQPMPAGHHLPPPPPAPVAQPPPTSTRPRRGTRVDHDYAQANAHGFFAAVDGTADVGITGVLHAFMASDHMTDMPTHLPTLRQQYPTEYAAATRAELGKLLELDVFEPADPAHLPSSALRYQTARLKLVAKWGRDFTGAHRLKIRAVAGGDEIERKAAWRGADESPPLPAAAPTITPMGLMMFLVLACVHRHFLVFFDVNSAYLHAEQTTEDDDVYLYLTREVAAVVVELRPTWQRFLLEDGRLLVHVQRALYGLRRSGRLWFERLMKLLLAFGFQPADTQPAFLLKHGGQALIIYVDDGILQVPREQDASPFIDHLNANLKLGIKTKMQTPHRFLGVNIWQSTDRSFATVAQTHLIDEIVELLKITPAQHKRVPAPADILTKGLLEGPPADVHFYASVVQKANYLWTTSSSRCGCSRPCSRRPRRTP